MEEKVKYGRYKTAFYMFAATAFCLCRTLPILKMPKKGGADSVQTGALPG